VVKLDAERVDKHPLHNAYEARNVAGQVGEQIAVLARIGHKAVLSIVLQRIDG
jgi:hypothetical protein